MVAPVDAAARSLRIRARAASFAIGKELFIYMDGTRPRRRVTIQQDIRLWRSTVRFKCPLVPP